MANHATSTYLITNAAKFRGGQVSKKQLKAILLYVLVLMADKRNSTQYRNNLNSLRAVSDNVIQDEDEVFKIAAEIAMVNANAAAQAAPFVSADLSLNTLLESSKVAAQWDEAAIDRAILWARGNQHAL